MREKGSVAPVTQHPSLSSMNSSWSNTIRGMVGEFHHPSPSLNMGTGHGNRDNNVPILVGGYTGSNTVHITLLSIGCRPGGSRATRVVYNIPPNNL